MIDARISAFIGAWDRMTAAGKFRHDFREQQPDIDVPYPPDYYALVLEAQVFAALATADTATGVYAAETLGERERQEESFKKMRDSAAEEFSKRVVDDEDPHSELYSDPDPES